jgi:hypothetical protein
VFLLDADVIRYKGATTPGQLIRLGRYTATLVTGEDALVLHWVQVEGKDKRPLSGLCAELGLKVGDVLA